MPREVERNNMVDWVTVTDNEGYFKGQFDYDQATKFDEEHDKKGVSVNTRNTLDHQQLVRTAGRLWVLYHWSDRRNVQSHAEFITDEQAARWLIRNGLHEDHATYFGKIEEIGPDKGGRPYVGKQFKIRLDDELVDLVVSDAAANGWNWSETIRVRLGERYEQMRKRPSGAGGSEDA